MRSSKELDFPGARRKAFDNAVHFVRLVRCGPDFGDDYVTVQTAVQHPRIAFHANLKPPSNITNSATTDYITD